VVVVVAVVNDVVVVVVLAVILHKKRRFICQLQPVQSTRRTTIDPSHKENDTENLSGEVSCPFQLALSTNIGHDNLHVSGTP